MKTTAIHRHRYATILFGVFLVIMFLIGYATYTQDDSQTNNSKSTKSTSLNILTNFKESNLSSYYNTQIIALGVLNIDDANFISLVGTSSDAIDLQPNFLNILNLSKDNINSLQKNHNYIAIITGKLFAPYDLHVTSEEILKIIEIPSKSNVQDIINNNLKNQCTKCIDKNILNCVGPYQISSYVKINWTDTNNFDTLMVDYLSTLILKDNIQISITQDLLNDIFEITSDYKSSICVSNIANTSVIYPTNDPNNEKIKINIVGNDENSTTYLNYQSN